MRDKEITLFNKNHITITKVITSNTVEENYWNPVIVYDLGKYNSRDFVKRVWVPRTRTVVEKESPLGFVYTQTNIVEAHYENKHIHWASEPSTNSITFYKCEFYIKNEIYHIVYPQVCNGVGIGNDVRPWEIADSGMADHYVDDLLKVMDELTAFIKAAKVNKTPHNKSFYQRNDTQEWDDWSFEEWKAKVYKELFGNVNGPRYQTNNEKILAHGFDLKESFRKPKQN